jgi:hypothetical protein
MYMQQEKRMQKSWLLFMLLHKVSVWIEEIKSSKYISGIYRVDKYQNTSISKHRNPKCSVQLLVRDLGTWMGLGI